jgi:hypothetical protein
MRRTRVLFGDVERRKKARSSRSRSKRSRGGSDEEELLLFLLLWEQGSRLSTLSGPAARQLETGRA